MWWSQMQKPANYAMSLMRWKKVADTTFWLDNSVCLCSGLQVRNKGTCINAQWLIEHEKKNTADTVLKNQCSNDKINTRKSKPWIIHKKEMRHRTEVEKKKGSQRKLSAYSRANWLFNSLYYRYKNYHAQKVLLHSFMFHSHLNERKNVMQRQREWHEWKKNTHTKLRKPIFSSTPRHTFWKFQASRAIFELRSVFFSFFGLCTFLLPIEKQKNSQERLKTRNRTWFRATFHRNVSITSYFNVIHIKMCIYKYVRPFSLLLFCTWTEQFCAPVF